MEIQGQRSPQDAPLKRIRSVLFRLCLVRPIVVVVYACAAAKAPTKRDRELSQDRSQLLAATAAKVAGAAILCTVVALFVLRLYDAVPAVGPIDAARSTLAVASAIGTIVALLLGFLYDRVTATRAIHATGSAFAVASEVRAIVALLAVALLDNRVATTTFELAVRAAAAPSDVFALAEVALLTPIRLYDAITAALP